MKLKLTLRLIDRRSVLWICAVGVGVVLGYLRPAVSSLRVRERVAWRVGAVAIVLSCEERSSVSGIVVAVMDATLSSSWSFLLSNKRLSSSLSIASSYDGGLRSGNEGESDEEKGDAGTEVSSITRILLRRVGDSSCRAGSDIGSRPSSFVTSA